MTYSVISATPHTPPHSYSSSSTIPHNIFSTFLPLKTQTPYISPHSPIRLNLPPTHYLEGAHALGSVEAAEHVGYTINHKHEPDELLDRVVCSAALQAHCEKEEKGGGIHTVATMSVTPAQQVSVYT